MPIGPKSIIVLRKMLEKSKIARYDVGVDTNDFTPISYNQIKTILAQRVPNRK